MNNYFDKIKHYNDNYTVENQESDLSQIISSINKLLNDNIRLKEFKKIRLSIVSDFINSSQIENDSLDFYQIKQLFELNLYCTDGFDNMNPICQPYEIIKNSTKNHVLLKPKKVIDLKKLRNGLDNYLDVTFSNFKYFDNRPTKNLEFYYPFLGFNTNEKAKANINIISHHLSANHNETYYFKIIDDEDANNIFPYFMKSFNFPIEKVCYAGKLDSFKVYQNDTVELSLPFSNSLINKNRLFLEISSIKYNTTEAVAISFKPKMPNTISHYLVFSFSFMLFSFAMILILPCLFIIILFFHNRVILTSWWDGSLISLPISLGLFWIYYFFTILINAFYSLYSVIIILILLLLATIPLFIKKVRKSLSVESEDHQIKFNIFGTIKEDVKFIFKKK